MTLILYHRKLSFPIIPNKILHTLQQLYCSILPRKLLPTVAVFLAADNRRGSSIFPTNFLFDLHPGSWKVTKNSNFVLVQPCKQYGVHSTPLRWIRSYLSNREHFNCTLESDQTNIIKFKYGFSTRINTWSPSFSNLKANDTVNSSNDLSFVLFS